MKHIYVLAAASLVLAGCQVRDEHLAISKPNTGHQGTAPTYVVAICGECHAVTADAISPKPEAPGFADIANSQGLTRQTLVAFLSDAHNYSLQMDVDLVEEDINLVADYMISLQSEDYIKSPS